MITHELGGEVVRRLSDRTFRMGRWNGVYAELQDDSEYLFVAIESGDFGKDDVDRAIKADTGNLLGDMQPSGGDDVLGRWRVVFKSHGEVVDAWGAYDL